MFRNWTAYLVAGVYVVSAGAALTQQALGEIQSARKAVPASFRWEAESVAAVAPQEWLAAAPRKRRHFAAPGNKPSRSKPQPAFSEPQVHLAGWTWAYSNPSLFWEQRTYSQTIMGPGVVVSKLNGRGPRDRKCYWIRMTIRTSPSYCASASLGW